MLALSLQEHNGKGIFYRGEFSLETKVSGYGPVMMTAEKTTVPFKIANKNEKAVLLNRIADVECEDSAWFVCMCDRAILTVFLAHKDPGRPKKSASWPNLCLLSVFGMR